LLLWLKGSMTPQEVRDAILDFESDFQKRIVLWLESVHCGEYMSGKHEDVMNQINEDMKNADYTDPTETMPIPPPELCQPHISSLCQAACDACSTYEMWKNQYIHTVDDLLAKSNVHNDGSKRKNMLYTGCMDNKWGKCKARFPRPILEQTKIDPDTGGVYMKKGESWLNTFTPAMTYLFRCNTDVTNLSSGTAIKAVVLYVSDYITKSSLKTHVIFDAIVSVFNK
ncbi:hypothetical protein K435DRAFT_568474, partial [Dendrothele bispora CBS 962.96]